MGGRPRAVLRAFATTLETAAIDDVLDAFDVVIGELMGRTTREAPAYRCAAGPPVTSQGLLSRLVGGCHDDHEGEVLGDVGVLMAFVRGHEDHGAGPDASRS